METLYLAAETHRITETEGLVRWGLVKISEESGLDLV